MLFHARFRDYNRLFLDRSNSNSFICRGIMLFQERSKWMIERLVRTTSHRIFIENSLRFTLISSNLFKKERYRMTASSSTVTFQFNLQWPILRISRLSGSFFFNNSPISGTEFKSSSFSCIVSALNCYYLHSAAKTKLSEPASTAFY